MIRPPTGAASEGEFHEKSAGHSPSAESLDIRLDAHWLFEGSPLDAEHVILRADGAIAVNDAVSIAVIVSGEVELRATARTTGSPETRIAAAKAKLAIAAIDRRRASLDGLLRFFLLDARFRNAFVPHRDRAAICLVSLINDAGQKHGGDGFTKIDLFPERERSVGASIMLRAEEMRDLATADDCKSVEQYKAKLIALQGETLMALPESVRLELAYPAIVRDLARLNKAGQLREEWLRPVNWVFGIG